jgi:hypothetical protein
MMMRRRFFTGFYSHSVSIIFSLKRTNNTALTRELFITRSPFLRVRTGEYSYYKYII